jgi:four helix bundle protein
VTYKEWLSCVPAAIKGDALWKVTAYRNALFLQDISWSDVTKLVSDRRTRGLAGQLYEAIGSIAANTSEGYSRSTGRDRARFYEYALGSAREARTWYYGGRHVIGDRVANHRIDLLTDIIRPLTTMVPDQRAQKRLTRTNGRAILP